GGDIGSILLRTWRSRCCGFISRAFTAGRRGKEVSDENGKRDRSEKCEVRSAGCSPGGPSFTFHTSHFALCRLAAVGNSAGVKLDGQGTDSGLGFHVAAVRRVFSRLQMADLAAGCPGNGWVWSACLVRLCVWLDRT